MEVCAIVHYNLLHCIQNSARCPGSCLHPSCSKEFVSSTKHLENKDAFLGQVAEGTKLYSLPTQAVTLICCKLLQFLSTVYIIAYDYNSNKISKTVLLLSQL